MRCERASSTNAVISAYKMRKSVGKNISTHTRNIKFRLFYSLFLHLSPEMMLRAVFKLGHSVYVLCRPRGIKFKAFFVGGRLMRPENGAYK